MLNRSTGAGKKNADRQTDGSDKFLRAKRHVRIEDLMNRNLITVDAGQDQDTGREQAPPRTGVGGANASAEPPRGRWWGRRAASLRR